MNKGIPILLLTAAIWGFSLVSQQAGMALMGPWSFTAVRCTLAGLVLLLIMVPGEKKKKREITDYSFWNDTKRTLFPSFVCFVFLELTIMEQQFGLLYTGVGKGAFITAFYIFLTPLIGLFLRQKVSRKKWISVAVALAGLFLITAAGSITGESTGAFSQAVAGHSSQTFLGLNKGDIIMFFAAIAYALYIHAVDRYTEEERKPKMDIVKLSAIQFIMIGIFSWIVAVIAEPGDITWANCTGSWLAILYAGVISAGGGFTLQMVGQRYMDPTTSSIILSSETVFSMLAGWICFHEILTWVEYMGCAIMVIAIAMAVIPGKKQKQ